MNKKDKLWGLNILRDYYMTHAKGDSWSPERWVNFEAYLITLVEKDLNNE